MKDKGDRLDPVYDLKRQLYPSLLPNESLELLRKFKRARSKKLRIKFMGMLVRGNQGLVISIALKFRGQGVGINDLVQEGSLGLIEAIERFSFDFRTRFSTYATHWIMQKMRYAVIEQNDGVCFTPSVNNAHRAFKKNVDVLIKRYGRKPTPTEISEHSGHKIGTVKRRLREISRTTFSFESTLKGAKSKGDGETLESFLVAERTQSPSNRLEVVEELSERRQSLAHFFGLLEILPINDRDRKAFKLYYGLGGFESMTLEKVGETLGITKERVRQLNEMTWQLLVVARAPYHNESSLFKELRTVENLQNIIGEVGDAKSIRPQSFTAEQKDHRLKLDDASKQIKGCFGTEHLARRVVLAVASEYGLSLEEMLGKVSGKKKHPVPFARALAAYLIRLDVGRTCLESALDVGFATLGYVSTVSKKIKMRLETDEVLRLKVESIRTVYKLSISEVGTT